MPFDVLQGSWIAILPPQFQIQQVLSQLSTMQMGGPLEMIGGDIGRVAGFQWGISHYLNQYLNANMDAGMKERQTFSTCLNQRIL